MKQNSEENWKVCPCASFFEVSTMGQVRSISTGKILKPCNNNHGYLYVTKVLHKKKHFYIHRLVASTFLENPMALPEVNHIDGNKSNNSLENLEWCTRSENMNHAYQTGLKRPSEKQRQIARANAPKSLDAMRTAWHVWRDTKDGQKISRENAIRNGLLGSAKTSKKVMRLSDGKIYASISEASRDNKQSHKTIRKHCSGKAHPTKYSFA